MSIVSPPSVGYPDYQPGFRWDGPTLINELDIDGGGSPTFGPFPCASFWGCRYWLSDFSLDAINEVYVESTWFTDLGLTTRIGQSTLKINDYVSQWQGVSLPNLGAWLTVNVSSTFASDTTLIVSQTNRITPPFIGDVGYPVLSRPTIAVAPSVTLGNVPQSMFSGRVSVNCTSTQNGTLALVGSPPGYSTFTAPWDVTAGVPLVFDVELPFSPWRFDFTNTSSGSADFALLVLGKS